MSLKKGGAPKTLQATLTIVGQGSADKLEITYHNRKTSEVQKTLEDGCSLGGLVVFLVESWGTDFELTEEGVREAEDEYPGLVDAIITGFHRARRKELEKN